MKKITVAVFTSLLMVAIFGSPTFNQVHAIGVDTTIKVGLFPEGIAYDSSKGEIIGGTNTEIDIFSNSSSTIKVPGMIA